MTPTFRMIRKEKHMTFHMADKSPDQSAQPVAGRPLLLRRDILKMAGLAVAGGALPVPAAGEAPAPPAGKGPWFALIAQEEKPAGMVLVPAGSYRVGTSLDERKALAGRFGCHPTWIGDDLADAEVPLEAYWMDRHPVTNAEYLAFVRATGHGRPSWWQPGDAAYPARYADHPVVGVSGADARRYAAWAHKRLPSAEEWEVAMAGKAGGCFSWGDEWPGPLRPDPPERPDWMRPGTRPVGSGACGRSLVGVEDFAGQAMEWVDRRRPHHGVAFQLLKGASWFHEDPVSFRVASGSYAYEGWRSAFTGFRCALDGGRKPGPTPAARSAEPEAASPRDPAAGPIRLHATGGLSRHMSIEVPALGPERFHLTAPETVLWNGANVMSWDKTPDISWSIRRTDEAAYRMKFEGLLMEAVFSVDGQRVEQRFTAVNRTDEPGEFRTSSCFSLVDHPRFYDCEYRRTYALHARGELVPLRQLSRGGDCVRWITGPQAEELGGKLPRALLAVVSRDGRHVVATTRAGEGGNLGIHSNALFTCLHVDASTTVPARGRAVTRQTFEVHDMTLDEFAKEIGASVVPARLPNP